MDSGGPNPNSSPCSMRSHTNGPIPNLEPTRSSYSNACHFQPETVFDIDLHSPDNMISVPDNLKKEPFRPQPHKRSPFFISKPPLGTPLEREIERLRQGGLAHKIFLFIEKASIPPSTRETLRHFALSMRPKNIRRAGNRINAILYKLRRRGPIVLIPANGDEKINILNFDDRWTLSTGFWTRL